MDVRSFGRVTPWSGSVVAARLVRFTAMPSSPGQRFERQLPGHLDASRWRGAAPELAIEAAVVRVQRQETPTSLTALSGA